MSALRLSVLLIQAATARCFLRGIMRFVSEDALLGGAAASAFLAATFLDSGTLCCDTAFLAGFDFIEQQLAGEETVDPLLARLLALDLQASRAMEQHDARGSLVDVLATMAAGAHEGFFDVGVAHAKGGHALRELIFFFQADRKCAHGSSVAKRQKSSNRQNTGVVGDFGRSAVCLKPQRAGNAERAAS